MEFSISSIKFKELINKEKVNILDIRNNYEYLYSHIPGAINAPANILLSYPEQYMNKNEIYYIYCNFGATSKSVRDRLNNLGYHVISVDDGLVGYTSR